MAKKAKKVIKGKAVKKVAVKKPLKKAAKKIIKTSAKKSAKKKKEDLICFLTTACVDHYGLKDNGYELTTLRNYRDTYLAKSEAGKKLIQTYYKVSPPLVELINKDVSKEIHYTYIYDRIQEACAAIEKRHFVKAKNIYSGMVNTLIENYSI